MTTTRIQQAIEQKMRLVLAELELVAHGTTKQLDANRVHASRDPAQVLYADRDGYPHLIFRARFEAARTDAERVQVLRAAQAELRGHRRPPAPRERHLLEPYSVPWRRAVANDRRPIAQVAREWMTSRQTVRDCIANYRDDAQAVA